MKSQQTLSYQVEVDADQLKGAKGGQGLPLWPEKVERLNECGNVRNEENLA